MEMGLLPVKIVVRVELMGMRMVERMGGMAWEIGWDGTEQRTDELMMIMTVSRTETRLSWRSRQNKKRKMMGSTAKKKLKMGSISQ